MKQIITYKLTPDGWQPYLAMDAFWLVFEWGLTSKDGVYMGIVEWEEADINSFISDNIYKATVITKEEAEAMYTANIPEKIEPIIPSKEDMIASFINKLE